MERLFKMGFKRVARPASVAKTMHLRYGVNLMLIAGSEILPKSATHDFNAIFSGRFQKPS